MHSNGAMVFRGLCRLGSYRLLTSIYPNNHKLNEGAEKMVFPSLKLLNVRKSSEDRKTSDNVCKHCKTPLSPNLLICHKCQSLQLPGKDLDYFDIFGLKRSFDIKSNYLSEKYHQMQTILHPDRYASKGANELKIAEEYSSLVNKAYRTLRTPLSRGLYLLELNGVTIGENTSSDDQEFLMEIMELNEELDKLDTAAEIHQFSSNNAQIMSSLIDKISSAFNSQDIDEAKSLLVKLKYYSTISLKVKTKKQFLGIPD